MSRSFKRFAPQVGGMIAQTCVNCALGVTVTAAVALGIVGVIDSRPLVEAQAVPLPKPVPVFVSGSTIDFTPTASIPNGPIIINNYENLD